MIWDYQFGVDLKVVNFSIQVIKCFQFKMFCFFLVLLFITEIRKTLLTILLFIENNYQISFKPFIYSIILFISDNMYVK